MTENLERKILQIFVAKWLRDKLNDFFREIGDIAKHLDVPAKEVKLFMLDLIEENLKIAREKILAEKDIKGGRKFWEASMKTKED